MDNQHDAGPPDGSRLLAAPALDQLLGALHAAGYRIIGPVLRDDAITLGELDSPATCPSAGASRWNPAATC